MASAASRPHSAGGPARPCPVTSTVSRQQRCLGTGVIPPCPMDKFEFFDPFYHRFRQVALVTVLSLPFNEAVHGALPAVQRSCPARFWW